MKRKIVAAVAALLLTFVGAGIASGNAADPFMDFGWKWSKGYVGTFRYDSSFPTTTWMRQAATASVNHISHSPYQNPDFNITTSSTANVHLQFLNGDTTSCAGSFGWVGCAKTTLNSPFTTWWVILASNRCWTNGTSSTCTTSSRFDVQTVTLNEMGHVSFLGHHVNPDYSDAVVQAQPVAYPNTNWSMRTLRQMDNARLGNLYGLDPCTVPPCPEGADQ